MGYFAYIGSCILLISHQLDKLQGEEFSKGPGMQAADREIIS